jgi:hypothetical protein
MKRIFFIAFAELLALFAHGLHKIASALIDAAIWLRRRAGFAR